MLIKKGETIGAVKTFKECLLRIGFEHCHPVQCYRYEFFLEINPLRYAKFLGIVTIYYLQHLRSPSASLDIKHIDKTFTYKLTLSVQTIDCCFNAILFCTLQDGRKQSGVEK